MKTKFAARAIFLGLVLLATMRAFGVVNFTVSPNTVSNSYAGYVTLQVTGITSGDTVLVQKFLDANTNGVIDSGDLLRQQFQLTDGQPGMVIGGVTNVNVPGDTDLATTQITAPLNYPTDNSQSIIGKYFFRLSSPAGHFTAITNSFIVTNAAYSPSITVTGNVVSAGTNVPNAVVLLFVPSGNNLKFQGGAMANNSGAYSMKAPPGTYVLLASKTNYVTSFASAPVLTLTNGQSSTNILTLTNATQSISGKIVDAANSSVGLPGMVVSLSSTTNSWFTLAFTDTNGNFTVGTRPDQWKISKNESASGVYGYLAPQNSTKVNTGAGSVSGVTISQPKATALFYGLVTNVLGTPFVGVDIFASDNNSTYESDTRTDVNGYYTIGALCGTGTNWQVHISDDTLSVLTNNIFSLPPVDENGGTNLNCGTTASARADFTAIYATNHVTGWIHDSSGNPLTNVQLYAYTTFGTVTYITQVNTDTSGNYWMNLGNGAWTVVVNCCGCTDCGGGCLPTTSYQCPDVQIVTINNTNTTAYFTAPLLSQPVLSQPTNITSGQFGFYLTGAVGSNYTIRATTNITLPFSNWPPLLITNLPISPAFIRDSHATNKQMFYRALLGP